MASAAVVPPPPPLSPPPAGRQVALVAVSQLAASGGNFVAALLAARRSDAVGFGSIGLLLAFYLTAVQLVRPFAGQVIQVNVGPRGFSANWAEARSLLRIAFWLAALGSMAFAPIAFGLFAGAGRHLLWVALAFVPFLVVHDTMRVWAIAVQRPHLAVVLDLGWLAVLCLGLGSLELFRVSSGAAVTVAWAGSGAVVAAIGWVGCCWGRPVARREARAAAVRFGRVYFLDAILGVASISGFVLLLPVVVSVEEIGRLRVLEMPFGVLAMASQGIALFLVPSTRRLLAEGWSKRAWSAVTATASGLAVASAAIAALVLAIPQNRWQAVFGANFRPQVALVVAIAVKFASFGLVLMGTIMAKSLGARRETLPLAAGGTAAAVTAALALSGFSLSLGYVALYLGLSLTSLVIVRRLWRRPFTAETV